MTIENTNEEVTQVDEVTSSAGTENTVDNVNSKKIPYDRFKAKVDEANELKQRLAEFEKEREEAERKRLEEAENYKELAEKYREELEAQKVDALNAKKDAILTKVGYSDEQITLLRGILSGSTDEELMQSIEDLKKAFPVKPAYVDPSAMNGGNGKPDPKDPKDYGRELFKSIIKK